MIHQNYSPIKLKPRKRGVREAAEVLEKRFGYFPQVFRWRGRTYEVDAVERCWTSVKRGPRLCFRVRCRETRYELTQDVRLNKWEVALV